MGAAASTMDDNTLMSLDKLKSLAGDKWNDDMECKNYSVYFTLIFDILLCDLHKCSNLIIYISKIQYSLGREGKFDFKGYQDISASAVCGR